MPKKESNDKESEGYPMRESYKGRQITIRSPEATAAKAEDVREGASVLYIDIDDETIEVLQKGPDEFQAIVLPYQTYASLLDLAKDAIDYVPRFKRRADS